MTTKISEYKSWNKNEERHISFLRNGGFGFLNFSRKNILQKLQRSLDTFGLFGGI
jgi:hypothetical protein